MPQYYFYEISPFNPQLPPLPITMAFETFLLEPLTWRSGGENSSEAQSGKLFGEMELCFITLGFPGVAAGQVKAFPLGGSLREIIQTRLAPGVLLGVFLACTHLCISVFV